MSIWTILYVVLILMVLFQVLRLNLFKSHSEKWLAYEDIAAYAAILLVSIFIAVLAGTLSADIMLIVLAGINLFIKKLEMFI